MASSLSKEELSKIDPKELIMRLFDPAGKEIENEMIVLICRYFGENLNIWETEGVKLGTEDLHRVLNAHNNELDKILQDSVPAPASALFPLH